MKQHGTTLLSDNAQVVRVITSSGPTLPESPVEEQLFTLTDVGGNTDHQFLGGEWIDITGSTAHPYDLSVDAINGATLAEALFAHVAARPFKLTGQCFATATGAGASTSTFDLIVNDGADTVVQTVTFAASATTATFDNTDVVFIKRGSKVTLMPTLVDENLVGLTFTFAGELIYPR
jgi:hypothetical protein